MKKYLLSLYHLQEQHSSLFLYIIVKMVLCAGTIIGMLMVMLLVIIPKFSQVYSQLGAGLPAATRQMIDFSTWFGNNVGFLGFVTFTVVAVIWLISKTQKGGYALDSFILKIPVFGTLTEQSILNKFCKTFGFPVK